MRLPISIAVTAAIAAVTLVSGVSTAAAAKTRQADRPRGREASAPDAEAAAAAERIAKEGSALGSYWDPDRAELVVVVGPDSEIGEAEVEKLVAGPARLERLDIAKKTVDAIREQIAAREFSPEAEKFSYASHLDLETGKVVLQTDAPASVTDRLIKEHPGRDRASRGEARPGPVPPSRRHPALLGRRLDPERRRDVQRRVHGPQAVGCSGS